MKTVYPNVTSVTLMFLGLKVRFTQVDSFSPLLSPAFKLRSTVTEDHAFARDIKEHSIRSESDDLALYMSKTLNRDLNSGQVVSTRFLHRFSRTKSSIQSPYTIEERQKYRVSSNGPLIPISKSLTFRFDEASNDGDKVALSTALHTIEGLEIENGDTTSSYALALYCMLHPEIINGEGLEVMSGEGAGGILSVIGAGIASSPGQNYNDAEVPTPSTLSSILMIDSNEQLLNTCDHNLGQASFPAQKVQLGLLDWNRSVQDSMKDQFDFIIGCDCAREFVPLAKIAAHSLKSSSSANGSLFVHVGPENRKNTSGLNTELVGKHRMNAIVKDVVLERIQLAPSVSDSTDAIDSEFEYLQAANIERKKYSVFIGYRDERVEEIFASDPSEISETLLRAAYSEWCDIFKKEIDENRFLTFSSNFQLMKAIANDRGEPMKLNQWYDCTEEEYYARTRVTDKNEIARNAGNDYEDDYHEDVDEKRNAVVDAQQAPVKLDKAKMNAIEALAEMEVSQYAEAQAEMLVTGKNARFSSIENDATATAEASFVEQIPSPHVTDRATEILREEQAEEIGTLAIEAQTTSIEAQVESSVDNSVEIHCEKVAEERADK